MRKRVRLSVTVRPDTLESLLRYARREDRSLSNAAERLLVAALDREGETVAPPPRD